MLERNEPQESTPPSTCRTAALTEETPAVVQKETTQPVRDEGFVRVRMAVQPQSAHRADVLYNWTPADRSLRFEKEATWRPRTVSADQTRRFNRCTGGTIRLLWDLAMFMEIGKRST
ncbi:unnamed protein product [Heligmosomoides polygyrus]|uniref:Uncharacterized protein n=1 Tax=Heligmosomoides polygyrus TaxID=6339 RepID=A0A183F8A9_HELPZ|nr:unnamed protein product [Heligmosomoides polygyrus]